MFSRNSNIHKTYRKNEKRNKVKSLSSLKWRCVCVSPGSEKVKENLESQDNRWYCGCWSWMLHSANFLIINFH